MKYKDYLIIPVLAMYLLFASFAYLRDDSVGAPKIPVATVDPTELCFDGDVWYEAGARSSGYFSIDADSHYVVKNHHLMYSTQSGTNYDLIFTDAMTAYDCNSGVVYQRGDYSTLMKSICSGKFVNSENEDDYYIFKDNGRSIEYFGDKVYKGEWNFETADAISVYDNTCKGTLTIDLIYSGYGAISGFCLNDTVFNLIA